MFFNLLVTVLLLTRVFSLSWGNGYFFHPDENNMAWAVERLSWPELNPGFFAYGQFPLYLVYYFYQFLLFVSGGGVFARVPFDQAVYLLRLVSALFSVLTVLFGYQLAKQLALKNDRLAKIYSLLLVFCPGLVQATHFGTTESILIFSAVTTAFFGFRFWHKQEKKDLFFLGLVLAIGVASKASAALFLPVAFLLVLGRPKRVKNLFIFTLCLMLLVLLLSPYSLLDYQSFLSTFNYEARVASGAISVFYTSQFIDSQAFVFQLLKILPWVLGLPSFVFLIFTVFKNFKNLFKKSVWSSRFLIPAITILPWLIFNGLLFAKWTRFLIPVVPFLLLIVAWQLSRLSKKMSYLLLLVLVLPGIVFSKIYFEKDIRIKTSDWLNQNIPVGSVVLSEGGNVVDLPVGGSERFETINFDFYSLENNPEKQDELVESISRADYVLLPSRRVFANRWQRPETFPATFEYYQQLFSGQLGFKLVKEFKVFNWWQEILLGGDLSSEETWTVFDHPTIRLFGRID
ncbi:MAG: glycosyltransferase family 39 protein [Patescibacteria group bacterium]